VVGVRDSGERRGKTVADPRRYSHTGCSCCCLRRCCSGEDNWPAAATIWPGREGTCLCTSCGPPAPITVTLKSPTPPPTLLLSVFISLSLSLCIPLSLSL